MRNEVFIGEADAAADIDDRDRVGVPEMSVADVEQVRRFALKLTFVAPQPGQTTPFDQRRIAM